MYCGMCGLISLPSSSTCKHELRQALAESRQRQRRRRLKTSDAIGQLREAPRLVTQVGKNSAQTNRCAVAKVAASQNAGLASAGARPALRASSSSRCRRRSSADSIFVVALAIMAPRPQELAAKQFDDEKSSGVGGKRAQAHDTWPAGRLYRSTAAPASKGDQTGQPMDQLSWVRSNRAFCLSRRPLTAFLCIAGRVLAQSRGAEAQSPLYSLVTALPCPASPHRRPFTPESSCWTEWVEG